MDPTAAMRRIEEAALNAWPALNCLLYDGWLLRFANGYTKRANSVTPMFPGRLAIEEKINFCESIYKQQHLQSIFRLTTITDLGILDDHLAARDYKLVDRTRIQVLDLENSAFSVSPRVSILGEKNGLRSWLDTFHKLNPQRMDDQTHEKMLDRIIGRTNPMVMTVNAEVVACGLGVVEGQYLGLFDIVTADEYRRKGYAAELTRSLLAWGHNSGAQYAYLQVMENNTAANQLYGGLGFQDSYRYWYRIAQPNTI